MSDSNVIELDYKNAKINLDEAKKRFYQAQEEWEVARDIHNETKELYLNHRFG